MNNQETKELFYENNQLSAFDARVIGVIAYQDSYGIILNQTAFYPEGGGQPGDTGSIGDTQVIDTRNYQGHLIHITPIPIEVGLNVNCRIDYDRRRCLMQNHTGEHMLSGVLNRLYGCQNVGFHMGTGYVSIDTDKEVTNEQLLNAELQVNKGIYENLPVSIFFPNEDERTRLSYRSKTALEGDVRIVSIEGYDACACCGIHCSYTGEVGIIKILSHQRYKGGSRIFLVCGTLALQDYQIKNEIVSNISELLSAKTDHVFLSVEQLKNEMAQMKYENGQLKDSLFQLKAQKYQKTKNPILFEEHFSSDDIKKYCTSLYPITENAFVFSAVNEHQYKYAIGCKNRDARTIAKELNNNFNGKGGGQKELVQGSITGEKNEIEQFIVTQMKTP